MFLSLRRLGLHQGPARYLRSSKEERELWNSVVGGMHIDKGLRVTSKHNPSSTISNKISSGYCSLL
jgi:hypothetical protein